MIHYGHVGAAVERAGGKRFQIKGKEELCTIAIIVASLFPIRVSLVEQPQIVIAVGHRFAVRLLLALDGRLLKQGIGAFPMAMGVQRGREGDKKLTGLLRKTGIGQRKAEGEERLVDIGVGQSHIRTLDRTGELRDVAERMLLKKLVVGGMGWHGGRSLSRSQRQRPRQKDDFRADFGTSRYEAEREVGGVTASRLGFVSHFVRCWPPILLYRCSVRSMTNEQVGG